MAFLPAVVALSLLGQTQPLLGTMEQQEAYRTYFPQTEDRVLSSLLKRDICFYTDAEMPQAYQHDGSFHSPHYNISASHTQGSYPFQYFGGREPFGNGNIEFPWGKPAGTHESENANLSIKFFVLPKGSHVEVFRQSDHVGSFYNWRFPNDTVFGEILTVRDSKGDDYTFEVRTRTRVESGWIVNAYRPFASPEQMAERIKQLDPLWKYRPEMRRCVEHLLMPTAMLATTISNPHEAKVFDRRASTDSLPPMPDDMVRRLLKKTPFRSVLGQEWRSGDDPCHAPTTEASFHIVPTHYLGSHVAVNRKSCADCHDTTTRHVNDMQMFLPGSGQLRDWYGRVRGGDAIFSWHPVEPYCISGNGFNLAPVFRQRFLQEGVIRVR